MPTYEYRCEACEAGWEMEQRISEDPAKVCPKCGAAQAKRLISGGNFMLKGEGWYKDLYHKPSGKKSGDSGSTAGSSGESSSSSSGSSDGGSAPSKSTTTTS